MGVVSCLYLSFLSTVAVWGGWAAFSPSKIGVLFLLRPGFLLLEPEDFFSMHLGFFFPRPGFFFRHWIPSSPRTGLFPLVVCFFSLVRLVLAGWTDSQGNGHLLTRPNFVWNCDSLPGIRLRSRSTKRSSHGIRLVLIGSNVLLVKLGFVFWDQASSSSNRLSFSWARRLLSLRSDFIS